MWMGWHFHGVSISINVRRPLNSTAVSRAVEIYINGARCFLILEGGGCQVLWRNIRYLGVGKQLYGVQGKLQGTSTLSNAPRDIDGVRAFPLKAYWFY